jgi:hypothetical protein
MLQRRAFIRFFALTIFGMLQACSSDPIFLPSIDDLTLVEIKSIDAARELGRSSGDPGAQSAIFVSTRANLPELAVKYDLYISADIFFCDESESGILASDPFPFFKGRSVYDYKSTGEIIKADATGLFVYNVVISDHTWVWQPHGDKSRKVEFHNPPKPICLQIVGAKPPIWPTKLRSNIIVISSPRA